MALEKKSKQPQDVIDYPVDYSEWLAERSGYAIDTYTVTAETGIDLDALVDVGCWISAQLGRDNASRVARAVSAKRAGSKP